MINPINRRNFMRHVGNTAAVLTAAVFSSPSFSHACGITDAGPKTHTIEIRDFAFTPDPLQVNPGDTVVWINRDIVPHTATADDGSWDTGTIPAQGTGSVDVTQDSAQTYYCRHHPGMKATIVVSDSE